MPDIIDPMPSMIGRAPRGARGLKYTHDGVHIAGGASRPSRGAWIEMQNQRLIIAHVHRRAPRGARGLKYIVTKRGVCPVKSRPSRGAWIEI